MIENPQEYWNKRYSEQGELTTGYRRHNAEQQEKYYAEKKQFIKSMLPNDIGAVFDFGCGKYQKLRDLFKDYQGYDIALNNHFPLLFDTFFTANVFQHNTWDNCAEVLKRVLDAKYIILYEAITEPSKKRLEQAHCISRYVRDYENLVYLNAEKKLHDFKVHRIHGQLHAIMIFK